jgi:predicted MFS family arabinose efflux permease
VVKLPETHRPTSKDRPPLKRLLRNYGTVLSEPTYLSAVSGVAFSWSMIVTFSVVGPFLLQETLGLSARLYGWSALLVGLGFFVGNLLNTTLSKTHTSSSILKLGLGLSLVTGLIMLGIFLAGLVDLITVMAPTFVIMVGIGLTFPNYYGVAVGVFTNELTGVANALIGALVLFGTVIYTIVLTALHAHAPLTLASVYVVLGLLSIGSCVMVSRRQTSGSDGSGVA